jgi:hypothetical protein
MEKPLAQTRSSAFARVMRVVSPLLLLEGFASGIDIMVTPLCSVIFSCTDEDTLFSLACLQRIHTPYTGRAIASKFSRAL